MRLDPGGPLQVPSRLPLSHLGIVAILLALLHTAVLILLGHSPSVGQLSDWLMLFSALFAMIICFLTSRRSHGFSRAFWYLTGTGFASWFLGKCFLIYDSYYLGIPTVRITPLLLFFLAGAPMFVTVFLSDDDFGNSINWEWLLDAFQILGVVVTIYLFVIYIPLLHYGEQAVSTTEDRLLLLRNILLTVGLLTRAIFSRAHSRSRLYIPATVLMGIFTVSTWIANRAQELSNAPETAWYDLAWSIPFCLAALAATLWQESPETRIDRLNISGLPRALFAYLPSLVLPVMLMVKSHEILREQIFLGLFGLMLSIVLFNVRLAVTLRRQSLTAEALYAAEQRYRSLFERNMAGVFRSTVDGMLLDCNPAFANMFGYSRDELRGISMSALYFGGTQERNQWIQELRTDWRPVPREARFRRKDGSALWVVLSVNLDKHSNEGERLEGTMIDITERRMLEAQFRQAQKMEAVGRLAGGVAHDFNNLLTIISGYSNIQFARTNPSDPTHREAEQIKAAADRAAALTQQLLAFTRQQVLRPRRVNLNDVVRNIDKMLSRLIGEDVEVLTLLAPNLGTVEVDPGQVDQVLMNLVVNARDAMPNGGKITIHTENVELDEEYTRRHKYVRVGHYILLAVTDNGTGMTPETQARIFEPFFTTKEPGKGTGLGLPMVYGIVKQSGGSIEVYSELQHGTSVKIYLPRVATVVEETTPMPGGFNMKHGSERILLVEDDAQIRGLVVDILTAHGYTVQVIEKPEELQAKFQHIPECALLLTDVVMPKLNGREVARLVAHHWPRIKILYMSGYTANALLHQGVLDEGLFFLQKPFTPAALVAKVQEVLSTPSEPPAQS